MVLSHVAFVSTHLDSCDALYVGANQAILKCLQLVLNTAAPF